MTFAAPAMLLTAAVTLLAILIAMGFSMMVSRVRTKVNIKPPAMSGDPLLERALRVQGNTLEGFVQFLPALWLAAIYFQGWIPPIIGLIWCAGRIIFAVGYLAATEKRAPGFFICFFSLVALVVLSAIGIVQAFLATSAT